MKQYWLLSLLLLISSCANNVSLAPRPVPDVNKFDGANIDIRPSTPVAPRFPIKAIRAKQEGWVLLKFDIEESGDVVNAEVTESSPEGVFEKAAIRAISEWKFPKNNTVKGKFYLMEFKLGR